LLAVDGRLLFVLRATTPFNTESDPNTKVVFVAESQCIKQKLLKTTDGGQTWTSLNEDNEFRYGIGSVFHSSNDGQTLLLATMRYWQGVGYEKWPYPSTMGNEARFNMSVDGGTTWSYSSGNWKKISDNLTRVQDFGNGDTFAIKSLTGQVGSKIGNSVVFILYAGLNKQNPYLYRSNDNGVTWEPGIALASADNLSFLALHNDSKDQFLAFCGAAYISAAYQYLFYGALVDKFTQWPTYGVTA
jgi:hypothetical protein